MAPVSAAPSSLDVSALPEDAHHAEARRRVAARRPSDHGHTGRLGACGGNMSHAGGVCGGPCTVVTAVATLSAASGSDWSAATVAPLTIVPPWIGRTTIVSDIDDPLASEPTAHAVPGTR